MSYRAIFEGWSSLSLEDLLVAYRKAKADCFFENTFPTAIKFAQYEQNLLSNLEALLLILTSDKGFSSNNTLIGEFRILPKKLSKKAKKSSTSNGHVHFSSPERTLEHLLKHYDFIPEFRIIGDFPVEAHIISALWINMIGHKFDAKLDETCYGARLKRLSDDEFFNEREEKPFHLSSIGSFIPYFQPYQRWRNDGLKAIRGELEKDRDILAVSLDLKSYYHFLDPMAITSGELHKSLQLELNEQELSFTNELAIFLEKWSDGAKEFSKKVTKGKANLAGGLVIGLTASRIISNVILHNLDRVMIEKLAPIHYGRYVDDMFLVLNDTGKITNSNEFMHLLKERFGDDFIKYVGAEEDQLWQINQGEELQGKSQIRLQSDKQKLFLLQGRAGLDLLDSIERDIYELSSEHRLMPSPDQLEDSTAARVLSASGNVGESADTLRRADGLTIRRLSWSLQLRHVETLSHDLPAKEWKNQREEFYSFAQNHILRADSLFAHFNYLPRLLGFAISMNDWQQAEEIVRRAYFSLKQLADIVSAGGEIALNGTQAKAGENIWNVVKGTLTWLFVDAAARYYDPEKLFLGQKTNKEKRLSSLFLKGIFDGLADFDNLTTIEGLLNLHFDFSDFDKKAPLVALADLAKTPYKHILHTEAAKKLVGKRQIRKESRILKVMDRVLPRFYGRFKNGYNFISYLATRRLIRGLWNRSI